MSHDLAELLGAAVPEPRSLLDPESVLQAARRRRSRRSGLIAGATALAMAGAVVGLLGAGLGDPSPAPRATADAGSTTSVTQAVPDAAGASLQRRLTANEWVLEHSTDNSSTAPSRDRTVLRFGAHGFLIDGACNDEIGHVAYTGGVLVLQKGSTTGEDCPADAPDQPVQALDDLAAGRVALRPTSSGIELTGNGVTATFSKGPAQTRDLGVELAPASLPAPVHASPGVGLPSTPPATASSPVGDHLRIDWNRLNGGHVVTAQQLPQQQGLTFSAVVPRFGITPTRIDVSTDAGQGAAGGLVELHYTFPVSAAFPVDGRVVVREQPVATAPDGFDQLAHGIVPSDPAAAGTPTEVAHQLCLILTDAGDPATLRIVTVRGKALITIAGPALSQAQAVALAALL